MSPWFSLPQRHFLHIIYKLKREVIDQSSYSNTPRRRAGFKTTLSYTWRCPFLRTVISPARHALRLCPFNSIQIGEKSVGLWCYYFNDKGATYNMGLVDWRKDWDWGEKKPIFSLLLSTVCSLASQPPFLSHNFFICKRKEVGIDVLWGPFGYQKYMTHNFWHPYDDGTRKANEIKIVLLVARLPISRQLDKNSHYHKCIWQNKSCLFGITTAKMCSNKNIISSH